MPELPPARRRSDHRTRRAPAGGMGHVAGIGTGAGL
jgi:hypothetical protein